MASYLRFYIFHRIILGILYFNIIFYFKLYIFMSVKHFFYIKFIDILDFTFYIRLYIFTLLYLHF